MNKADLVDEVMKIMNTKKEAQAVVNCFFDTIRESLKHKEQVAVVGFGTFKVASRKARTGRNPKTGEAIMIEGKNVPKFTPSRALMDSVEDDSE
jgi:nucleoid DNA-binding protein